MPKSFYRRKYIKNILGVRDYSTKKSITLGFWVRIWGNAVVETESEALEKLNWTIIFMAVIGNTISVISTIFLKKL